LRPETPAPAAPVAGAAERGQATAAVASPPLEAARPQAAAIARDTSRDAPVEPVPALPGKNAGGALSAAASAAASSAPAVVALLLAALLVVVPAWSRWLRLLRESVRPSPYVLLLERPG
jgi:hypothetical protein